MKFDQITVVRFIIAKADGDAFRKWADRLKLGEADREAENAYTDGGSAAGTLPPNRIAATVITDDTGLSTVQCLAFFMGMGEVADDVIPALRRLWESSDAGTAEYVEGEAELFAFDINVYTDGPDTHPKKAWRFSPWRKPTTIPGQ
jgi:hypothetical protein